MLLAMEGEGVSILTKIIDNSLTLGVLALGMWVMWKRDERYRANQDQRLKEMEAKLEKNMETDRPLMLEHLNRSTEVQHETNATLRATNKILKCFIDEMNDFKSGEVYQTHLQKRSHV